MEVNRLPDEIVVVNDGGSDDLRDKIKDMKRTCPIVYARVLKDIPWNYNGACNLGFWLSIGDYVVFEDNDNIPSVSFYEEAIQRHKMEPRFSRIQATKRKDISLEDFTSNPREEWNVLGTRGPNMGTALFPRETFLTMKGHDERFCGQYGYMYYDFRSRGIKIFSKEFYTASEGEYFYTTEGQTDLSRSMSGQNLSYYRDNARQHRNQHPKGILNFEYEFERLEPNEK